MVNNASSSGQKSLSVFSMSLRYLILAVVAAVGSVSAIQLFSDGYWQLAIMIVIITVFLVIIFVRPDAEPLRWLSPGLALFLVFVLFPLVSTIAFAFTNYGTTNGLTKPQVIRQYEQRRYAAEGSLTYSYTMFQDPAGNIALWLVPEEEGDPLFVSEGQNLSFQSDAIEYDDSGIPVEIGDYVALNRGDTARTLQQVSDDATFGEGEHAVQLSRARFGVASELSQRYTYDDEQDALIDNQMGTIYVADDSTGFFINPDNPEDTIPVGYQVIIGFRNFERFLTSPALRGPLVSILVWNFTFAILSVLFAFVLGLIVALTFGENTWLNKVLKLGFILPWTIPNVITILIWNGLWNPLDGAYSKLISDIAQFFGANPGVGWPPIYNDATWARVALLITNTWFAFPYFMLICSGALKSIPSDLYEAAMIDGANVWQRFRSMTLPLLLMTVGPLLIGSFATNFNSFQVIYLFNKGGPAMVGVSTPAGHTDLLISYVYKLSFGGGGGRQEFGYAAAITIIIFLLLAVITAYNLRFMNIWEETGENV